MVHQVTLVHNCHLKPVQLRHLERIDNALVINVIPGGSDAWATTYRVNLARKLNSIALSRYGNPARVQQTP